MNLINDIIGYDQFWLSMMRIILNPYNTTLNSEYYFIVEIEDNWQELISFQVFRISQKCSKIILSHSKKTYLIYIQE